MSENVRLTEGTVMDTQQIYELLVDEILRFVYKPGDVLSESHLCQRFSLSRTPMRAILLRLQENGLVKIVPRKGTTVTKINYDIVGQIIYERLAVETMVLRDFIRICSPMDVERVRAAHMQLRKDAEKLLEKQNSRNVNRFHEDDLTMHAIWFKATNKEYLWSRLSGFEANYSRFCTLDILSRDNIREVLKEHEEMLRLIEGRDITAIEPLLYRHMYGNMRRLSGRIFTEYADYFEPMGAAEGEQE